MLCQQQVVRMFDDFSIFASNLRVVHLAGAFVVWATEGDPS